MEALFLEHDGYFGALGTFLSSALGSDLNTFLGHNVEDGEEHDPSLHNMGSSAVTRRCDLHGAQTCHRRATTRRPSHMTPGSILGDKKYFKNHIKY